MLFRDYLKSKCHRIEFVPDEMEPEHREMLYDFLEAMNESSEGSLFKTRACIGCKYEKVNGNSPYRCDGCRKCSRYNPTANDGLFKAYIDQDIRITSILYDELHTKTPSIKNVIFNNPATIVFWSDGTKTVVKCQGDDDFDPEKGLAMAIAKKFLGNKGSYYNTIKKWLLKDDEQENNEPTIAFHNPLNEAFAKLKRDILDSFSKVE